MPWVAGSAAHRGVEDLAAIGSISAAPETWRPENML
jgi:hypothetical protein